MILKFFEAIDFYAMKNEFLGTFAIVFCSGWAWMNFIFKNCTILEVGATDFLVYSLFVWTGCPFSGGIYNPALTLWMIFLKKVTFASGVMYCVSQVLASMVAASMIKMMSPDVKADVVKTNLFVGFVDVYRDGGFGRWISISVYEAIGSAFVVLVYYMMIIGKRNRGNVEGKFSQKKPKDPLILSNNNIRFPKASQ